MDRMNRTNRRAFMKTVAAGGCVLAAGAARAQSKLDEKDATAVALGYVTDTAKADKKKYPKHEPTQSCANCHLFQGKAGPPTVPARCSRARQCPPRAGARPG